MNIQSTSSARELDEEYGSENEIEQSERSSQQYYQDSASSKRKALLQQALENTDSVSSTDRQLEQISPNKQR